MLADAPPPEPPAIIAPAQKEQRKKRRERAGARSALPALAIGAVIVLSDGSRCQIVAYSQGAPVCVPL